MKIDKTIKTRRLVILGISLFLLIVVISTIAQKSARRKQTNEGLAVFEVKRGPLTISVTESGSINPQERVVIKSEVEGNTTILSIVPDGSRVKKGDLLVELDASRLQDELVDQQIRVQNAEAAFVRARENLEVAKNQTQSEIEKAELAFQFAMEDLTKYKEGEYPEQLKEAESQITLTEGEFERAKETLKWSEILYGEKYISQTELEADRLSAKKRELDLELARGSLDLLKNYTYKRKLAELESDEKQTEMALERTTRKASADIIQAEADLRAKESEYKRQESKLEKTSSQIEKAKIYAPIDGFVVYATTGSSHHRFSSDEPIAEGRSIREREEIIHLPTDQSMMVEVKIHESNLEKVGLNMPVRVTIDALPGKVFTGHVAKISPLPDSRSMWMNPDLKVYATDIYIDSDTTGLRTGMSCSAEIIIQQLDNAFYVPVQAVLRVGGRPTVYVIKKRETEARPVEIGLDNNRMVHIISGLEEKEKVLLTPPLGSAGVETREIEESRENEGEKIGESPGGASGFEKTAPEPGEGLTPDDAPGREKVRPLELSPGDDSSQRPSRGEGRNNLTPEQREQRKKILENLSPEEQEKMRQEWRQRRQRDEQRSGGSEAGGQ